MWRRDAARLPATPDVPDCVEPVVAWRFWYATERTDRPCLSSINFDVPWPAGRPFKATCMMEEPRSLLWCSLPGTVHAAPAGDCGCGIYGVPAARLRRCIPLTTERPPKRLVLGRVSLWGLIHEHRHGWRASFAYPERLYVPSFADAGAVERIAWQLAEYRVPVELLDASTARAGVAEVVA